jgi:hypothetical protein
MMYLKTGSLCSSCGNKIVSQKCEQDRVVNGILQNEISQINSFCIYLNFYVYFAKYTKFCEILWNFCDEISFPAWQSKKTMLRRGSKK